jgi:hypothetical protein
MVPGRPERGSKRQQMLRAAKETKRLKREGKLKRHEEFESFELVPPEELLGRVWCRR